MKKDVIYIRFDSIGSTNDWAKAHAAELDSEQLTCIVASEQTAGRGRFRRKWISPKGQNLYVTFFFCVPKEFPYLANLGQILALSCGIVLRSKNFQPKIKWPNDILLDEKKVGGVLAEVVDLKDRLGCVLGIGINVNTNETTLATIDQPATSLLQTSHHTWNLEEILRPLLEQFLQDFEVLSKEGFSSFQAPFNEFLTYKGQTISCYDGKTVHKGICQGVNKVGVLELLTPSGEVIKVLAGEVLPLNR